MNEFLVFEILVIVIIVIIIEKECELGDLVQLLMFSHQIPYYNFAHISQQCVPGGVCDRLHGLGTHMVQYSALGLPLIHRNCSHYHQDGNGKIAIPNK